MFFLKKHFQSSISFHGIHDASHAIDGKLNIVNVWKQDVNIEFGTINVQKVELVTLVKGVI